MEAKLPNLELLEFKAKMQLLNTEKFNERKANKESIYRDNIILDVVIQLGIAWHVLKNRQILIKNFKTSCIFTKSFFGILINNTQRKEG